MKPDRRSAGFTLVEIMVALALAGLVSLIVMQGIGLATHGVGRLTERAERLDQRRAIEMQLRHMLGSTAAIPVLAGRPAFVGRPADFTFLSIAEDGGPGLYRITLAFDGARPDRPLTLTRQLADGAAAPRLDQGVMARDVSGFALAYFGTPVRGDKQIWLQSWEDRTDPPRLVRIEFDDGDGLPHPPIILALGGG
ncbi:MAG TPA: prepilin-type N-terminal cleavage/methylation domain-containing protein [Stellaceae bacterium]|jgi:general secretion pathway protein J|nr:prepilin-type N-terminal cleavage/methylation domain-containing protein [Stellaceae bacterium]